MSRRELCRLLSEHGPRALLLVPLRRERRVLGGLFRVTHSGDREAPVACRVGDRYPLDLRYQVQLVPLDAENYAPVTLYLRDLERDLASGRIRLFIQHDL